MGASFGPGAIAFGDGAASVSASGDAPSRGVLLTGSRGSVEAHIGDRFKWHDGATWEIVGFIGERTYSPSGLGGCEIVACRHVDGELSPHWQQFMVDGLCNWCGDSVATALILARDPALVLLERWLKLADSGAWRDSAGLSIAAHPVRDDTFELLRDRDGTPRRREAAEGEACQPGPCEDTASPELTNHPSIPVHDERLSNG